MFDRSGFGFITLPVIARLQNDLKKLEPKEWMTLIDQIINELKKQIPLEKNKKSKEKTTELIEQLTLLTSEIHSQDKALLINQFSDCITQFAGFLDKNKSIPMLTMLEKIFLDLENKFELARKKEFKTEDQKTRPKLTLGGV
jgi:hypothetical protein